ncbi:MAG: response regulator transcription factor [Flavobacteriales bacterium]|nr:response regulator transcription factor [Flavobacteriales bacterium]
MTAVIVDDEEHCRTALSGMLVRKFPEIDLREMADNVSDGLAVVTRVRPQLLFLDVEMGSQTGFDLLAQLGEEKPHIIFTTAHEGYALRAIRFSALDYLLKPVDLDELRISINKVIAIQNQPPDQIPIAALLRNLVQPAKDRRLALPVSSGLELISLDEIVFCESESNYTTVHLQDRKRLVISRTLKEFEDLLEGDSFIRVHHSHLINLRHVRKYIRGEGGEVIMVDGTNVPVSRRKKQELMDSLARL